MSRKAAGRLYTHVLDIMKKNGGSVALDNPDLAKLLESNKSGKSTMYRVAGYIYDIRKYAKLDVKAIRKGRKVVAYELVALSPASETAPAPAVAEPATV